MRVTMQTINNNILTNLNKITSDMNRLNSQISSGKQISKISDNPVNLVTALGLRTNLAEIGQYKNNIGYGQNFISASETSLSQIKDLILRANTLAIQQVNAPITTENRTNAAEEVRNIFEQAILLGNTQVNGKYIFGGYRTAGYTPAEPAPFVADKVDGYRINGTNLDTMNQAALTGTAIGNSVDLISGDLLINGQDVVNLYNRQTLLTGAVTNGADLVANDFLLNGQDIGPVDLTSVALVNGLNMNGAANFETAIDAQTGTTNVSANLTTLLASTAFTDQVDAGGATTQIDYDFNINGTAVNTISITGNATAAQQVSQFVAAINAVSSQTGVTAEAGTGANGGVVGGIVLKNSTEGDNSLVNITGFTRTVVQGADFGGDVDSVAGDFNNALSSAADATHNTGQTTLTATADYTITTSSVGVNDSILNLVGLGGGTATTHMPNDTANDGQIAVSYRSIDLSETAANGLPMQSAYNLLQAINDPAVQAATTVSGSLTTLYAGTAATGDTADGSASTIAFDLNTVSISVTIPDTVNTPAGVAALVRDAVNAASEQTGISAVVGDGANGGPADSVVLQNTLAGDNSAITIANLREGGTYGTALSGFANGNYSADASHNTGQVSLSSASSFEITSTNYTDDTVLSILGLAGGSVGFLDEAGDGQLIFGAELNTGNLTINGLAVGASASDGISDIYADASAAAKEAAINAVSDQTGVTASVTPVYRLAEQGVGLGDQYAALSGTVKNTTQLTNGLFEINNKDVVTLYNQPTQLTGTVKNTNDLAAGDLIINGENIAAVDLTTPGLTDGLNMGGADNLKTAVNLQTGLTNVSAALTTLSTSGVAAAAGTATAVSFTLTGSKGSVNLSYTTNANPATDTVAAINAVRDLTGIEAVVGDGANGGIAGAVVLRNVKEGDETAITIAGYGEVGGTATTGLANVVQTADATHNTGQISLSSSVADFTVSSKEAALTPPNDNTLALLGLEGGFYFTAILGDTANDGTITVGHLGIDLDEPATYGLNMDSAYNMREALNDPNVSTETKVTGSLTTLYAGIAATGDGGGGSSMSFDLNSVPINVTIAAGTNAAGVAAQIAADINAASGQTGVKAVVGDGANGGPLDSVVLQNAIPGDESIISITNYTETGTAQSGLTSPGLTVSQAADSRHNTGEVSFLSTIPTDSFDMTSPQNTTNDEILNLLGLGGGAAGTGDAVNDGKLTYTAGTYIGPDDLKINGVDIFATPTVIQGKDIDNVLLDAVNAQTANTGIVASRNQGGQLILTATDGRNLHIETSANGEKITHLNGGTPAVPQSKVFFGSLQLRSDRQFLLKTTPTAASSFEPGLATLGLSGGEAVTGEAGDIADDGEIAVDTIVIQDGSVRYNGDRDNDLAIKVGKTSTLDISKNGNDALVATDLFRTIKNFENYLLGDDYSEVTGTYQATDTTALLNSGETGLTQEDQLQDGKFTITISDHNYSPARTLAFTIPVNVAEDSLDDIATKINNLPAMSASWTAEGYLDIKTNDANRYTFTLTNDTSNFLEATGVTAANMQVHALSNSVTALNQLMDKLTDQISDFGARANRIQVQSKIYDDLELATTENLSDQQDTDITKAIMELKTKEVAYQAALSAAAKTMQLSLVDYL